MRHAAALGLACALASGVAQAQPFTVEHLLSLQDLTRAAFSPQGRYLVLNVEAPWKAAARYDLDANTYLALGRPMIVDLAATGARPLLKMEDGAGYTTGAFSADGSRIVVYRLTGSRLELGVTALATGDTVWSGLEVDTETFSPVARWIDDGSLLVLSRSAANTRSLGGSFVHQARSTAAWADQALGRNSGVVLGSGRYRALNPPPPSARLVVFDLLSGRSRQLAVGAFVDMTLSPDRRHVALVVDSDGRTAAEETPSLPKGVSRRRLEIADLKTGATITPCPECDLARAGLAWSPDSREVLAAARLDGDGADFRYWRLGVDGHHVPLAPDLRTSDSPGRDPRPISGMAWLSGDPVILAKRTSTTRLDWWRLSARGPINLTNALPNTGPALASDGYGLLLNSPEGPVRVTAAGKVERLAGASARLGYRSGLVGETVKAVIATERGLSRTIWPISGSSWPNATPAGDRLLDILPAKGLTAALSRDARGVKTVVVRDRRGTARTVLTLNAQLAAVRAATPIPVPHQASNGQARTSWLYLPASTQDRDVPVIVTPYPGSAYATPPAEAQPGELAFSANVQILTGAGYAVLIPSLPIADDAEPGEGLADALLRSLEAARLQHPELSASRAALWGQSFGGWGVLMAATQTDRFKAVIATSPIANLSTFYGMLSPQALAAPDRYFSLPAMFGWSETGQGRMLSPPWRAPDRYARNSPGLHSDRITAPVMLVTSDSDFTSGQATSLFSALFRQDKDAVLISYRGEGHVVINPDNLRDLYARAFSFLADTIGPAPPPTPTADRPSQ